MDRFFDALFLGLSSGAIYALVALCLVVVFRGTGDLNFAQGEMATLSAFITAIVAGSTIPLLHWVIPLWFATLVGMAFGFALGVSTEVIIVRPLKRRSPLAVFVALIALFLGINALTTGLWGAPPPETIGSLFPNAPTDFVRGRKLSVAHTCNRIFARWGNTIYAARFEPGRGAPLCQHRG